MRGQRAITEKLESTSFDVLELHRHILNNYRVAGGKRLMSLVTEQVKPLR